MFAKIFIFLIFIFVLMSGGFISHGAQFDYPWSGITEVGGQSGLVAEFYQIALALVSVTAFAVMVFAGVLYIVSASNPSKQKEAMDWIWAAVFGIVLLLGAYLLFYTINPELVKLTLPGVDKIDLPLPSILSPSSSPVLAQAPLNPAATNMISLQPPSAAEVAACQRDASTIQDASGKKAYCDGNKQNKYEWISGKCDSIATTRDAQNYCKQKGKTDAVFAKDWGVCCKP
ncbi:MAG: hypothetical protein AAB405_02300 [Patescibacteria group bacterium]